MVSIINLFNCRKVQLIYYITDFYILIAWIPTLGGGINFKQNKPEEKQRGLKASCTSPKNNFTEPLVIVERSTKVSNSVSKVTDIQLSYTVSPRWTINAQGSLYILSFLETTELLLAHVT